MPTITIPAPTGSFLVTIEDSSTTVVYGPVVQTNATFDPGITTPGDYVAYVDNSGADNGFCFTISECECPILSDVSVDMGTTPIIFGYARFDFDMSGGFSCPFKISGIVTGGSVFTVTINSLSDLVSIGGDIYRKTVWIGGYATSFIYSVTLLDNIICTDGNYVIECNGPVLCNQETGEYYALIPTNPACTEWDLYLFVDDCGSGCNSYTVNYLQTNALTSGVPDSGTYSDDAICGSGCTPNPIPINPNMNIVGFTNCDGDVFPIYQVTYTDCCGTTHTTIVTAS